MRIAESVTLTCWPPAPDDRYVSMRRSLGSISGRLGLVERGHRVERRERGLAARVRVERRDADEPVHALLAGEHAVRVPALHREGRRADAGLGALADVLDLDREARRSAQRVNMRSSICVQSCASVPPAPELTWQIASRSSYSPVNSARSSSRSSSPRSDSSPASISGSTRVVRLLAPELEQRVEVVDALVESVDQLDVVADADELARDLARRVLVVPEVGARRLGLELDEPRPLRRRCARYARAPRRPLASRPTRSSVKSRIGRSGVGVQRPWHCLNFLPLPQ